MYANNMTWVTLVARIFVYTGEAGREDVPDEVRAVAR